MSYYPVFFNLSKKRVLIAGGGAVALKKALSLLEAGALLTLIAPKIEQSFFGLKNVTLIQRKIFLKDISKKYFMVLAATDDSVVNSKIARRCEKLNIACNCCDNIGNSSFINAATIDMSPIFVAIISGGVPQMSKLVKEIVERCLQPELGQLASLLLELRPKIKQSKAQLVAEFIARWANTATLEQIKNEGIGTVKKEIESCL